MRKRWRAVSSCKRYQLWCDGVWLEYMVDKPRIYPGQRQIFPIRSFWRLHYGDPFVFFKSFQRSGSVAAQT